MPKALEFRSTNNSRRHRSAALMPETHSVFTPWGAEGKQLEQEIRNLKKQNRVPNRLHYRRAQQFTVQVYDGEWQHLKPSLSFHCEEAFAILDHPENDYHPHTASSVPVPQPTPTPSACEAMPSC